MLAATPLDASWGTLAGGDSFRKKDILKRIMGENMFFFLGAISLGRVVAPSPKIVIDLLMTFVKLHCKEDPYWFARSIITNSHRSYYFT